MTSQTSPQAEGPAAGPTPAPGDTELLYRRLFEAAAPAGPPSADGAGGDETILLVEDTSWLRDLIRRGLQLRGYTVLEAAHGEAALQLTATHPGRVHLLISDLGLPGINGRRLAERLGAMKPGIKLLFISGYTAEAVLRHGVLESESAFLQKPFTPRALAFKVRTVLDQ